MKKIFTILMLVFIASCATEAKYQAILNTWNGSSESHLIDKWGIPDGSYETDGKKYLVYKDNNVASFNGTAISYQCKTIFTIEKGIITHWTYEGNNCVAQ